MEALSSIFLLASLTCLGVWYWHNAAALHKVLGVVDDRPAWLKDPTNPATYPEPYNQPHQVAKYQEREQQQLDNLTLLGLPAPMKATDFSFLAWNDTERASELYPYCFSHSITHPTFTIPEYLLLPILYHVSYLILAGAAEQQQIISDLTHQGLGYVLTTYQGTFVDVDPYQWFRNTESAPPQPRTVFDPVPERAQLAKIPSALKRFLEINPDRAGELSTPPLFLSQPLPHDVWQFTQQDVPDGATIGVTDRDRYASQPTYHYVSVPYDVRSKHVYIVGKSGSGKSTLIANMAAQDIARGYGVCVIDPHGDLAEDILYYIPEEREKDTIYFNVADTTFPIPLNIMAAENDAEQNLLADDLLVTFKRLSESSWGERMENILRYTIHTLLASPGATFLDIQTLLQNPDYRKTLLSKLKNPILQDFWQHQFPSLPKDAAQPILNRMSKFSLSPALAGILSGGTPALDFFRLIQENKILIVNLAKGKVGEDNAKLLGSILVSQIQLAIMRRANLPKSARTPFMLYVDEFQNFTTSAFETILSEARKYQLCLTLAHQYITQIDPNIKNAILGNVGTMVVFPLAENDASPLRHELGMYDARSVAALDARRHEALYRPATSASETVKFTTLPPAPKIRDTIKPIVFATRYLYRKDGSPRPHSRPVDFPEPEPQAETNAPPPKPPAPEQQQHEPPPPPTARPSESNLHKTPAAAPSLEALSREEQILFYLSEAHYLSTRQITALVFSDIESPAFRKKKTSTVLSALEKDKQIHSLIFEREKIWYAGRKPSVRRHDVYVRDIFVAIKHAGYQTREIKFFHTLSAAELFNPDLSVTFAASDQTEIKTLWEFDNNTEGDEILLKKIERYRSLVDQTKIIFVFSEPARIQKLKTKIPAPLPPIYVTALARLGEGEGGHKGGMGEAVFGLFNNSNGDQSVRLFGTT